jgi:hypothetical protein
MKFVLAFVGMVIGQLIGGALSNGGALGWVIGIILGIFGYLLPGFIRYSKSSPKQLLAFHGPDGPINRSTSAPEIQTFLAQLHDGGLLLDFQPMKPEATVDRGQWVELAEAERTTFMQVLGQARNLAGHGKAVQILDASGAPLAHSPQ